MLSICYGVLWILQLVKTKTDFQADYELLEADESESNNNVQNEPSENDSEPEKVDSIAVYY